MFLFNVVKKDEDGNMKSFEFLKLLNRIIFRGVSCGKIVCYSGWSLLGVYSTTQLKYIIPFVSKLICGTAIVVGGLSLSTWIVSYFVYKQEEDEEVIIESEHEKYLNFINNDYDLFIDIYKNKSEKYFTNDTKTFVSDLKLAENHETYELPYSYNDKLIFYYDDDSQSFHYYCRSDVSCKILNSACRTYTIGKKCIQLFQDEEEINYMQGEASGSIDVSYANIETESMLSESNPTSPSGESEEEESNGFVNIFYSKKSTRKEKSNIVLPKKTNKFLYKGSINEYERFFFKKKSNSKQTSYEEYCAQLLK